MGEEGRRPSSGSSSKYGPVIVRSAPTRVMMPDVRSSHPSHETDLGLFYSVHFCGIVRKSHRNNDSRTQPLTATFKDQSLTATPSHSEPLLHLTSIPSGPFFGPVPPFTREEQCRGEQPCTRKIYGLHSACPNGVAFSDIISPISSFISLVS